MDNQNKTINPVEHSGRRGFLPIETNWFDRFFVGVMGHVALNLLWMRFFESGFKNVLSLIALTLAAFWFIGVLRRPFVLGFEDVLSRFVIAIFGVVVILFLWWRLIDPVMPNVDLFPIPLMVATVSGLCWIVYVIWKG